jgi:hypothetical protein
LGGPPEPARFSHTWIEIRFHKLQAQDPEVKYMFEEHCPSPRDYFAPIARRYAL